MGAFSGMRRLLDSFLGLTYSFKVIIFSDSIMAGTGAAFYSVYAKTLFVGSICSLLVFPAHDWWWPLASAVLHSAMGFTSPVIQTLVGEVTDSVGPRELEGIGGLI